MAGKGSLNCAGSGIIFFLWCPLYGEASLKRGIFFRLQVYKGKGISQVLQEVHERVGNLSFKDDFQSVLCTLGSLFPFFVLLHVRLTKCKCCNYLHEVIRSFMPTAIMDVKLCALLFLISLDETTL